MKPFEAALAGSREVGFTIVSITLSLVAVFLPILLMGGIIGRIFNEFAVVVTISIIASALVSLTFTPMLTARLPKERAHDGERRRNPFERAFDRVTAGYAWLQPANTAWTPEKSIEDLDRAGSAAAVISITNPGLWFGDNQATTGLRARATSTARNWCSSIRGGSACSRRCRCPTSMPR